MPSKQQSLHWQSYCLPKRGHSKEEYEDALAGDPRTGRFAVADGASESSFAGLWAKLLVGGFVHKQLREPGQNSWLAPLQARWAKEVDAKELAWFADEKRQQGAYATFLGVALKKGDEAGSGSWNVLAVGDSCFFQVRGDELVKVLPVSRSTDFGNLPNLVGSRSPKPTDAIQERGKWRSGDKLFLMTDAIAQWFLLRHEQGKKPWQTIEQVLGEQAEMTPDAWIEKMRDHQGMRNDDVTLIVVHM